MRVILGSHSFYIVGAAVLVVLAIVFLIGATSGDNSTIITTTVERGDVTELVSVSGVVEAENTAKLAFPNSGIVNSVLVDEGDVVTTGTVLARLEQAALQADRLDAIAAVQTARANRDELINGPTSESRAVTNSTIAQKKQALEKAVAEQNQKVSNALRTLLSSDLEAVSVNPNEDATPPTITGTYTCDAEGAYELALYASGARSGYSFRLAGLEEGTYPVTVDQPVSFGTCGLQIQFADTSAYSQSKWSIEIPNTKSVNYTTNKNSYELAKDQAESAISAAEDLLQLAQNEAILANADPRIEALQRAHAAVAQAEARLVRVNSLITDRTITAPFGGIITDVSIIPGETVTTAPVITLLAEDAFDLTARIPEIDIAKIAEGQQAQARFDAKGEESISAIVAFISPIATEIDGVAYYEAVLEFSDVPKWIRSGLNADIEIVVDQKKDVLRIPTRFISTNEDVSFVLAGEADSPAQQTVEVGFSGNDGFVEIIGLTEGATVVAP